MVYVIYTSQHPCWIISVYASKASAQHEWKRLVAVEGYHQDTLHILEAVLNT